jgi:hypothetical protein
VGASMSSRRLLASVNLASGIPFQTVCVLEKQDLFASGWGFGDSQSKELGSLSSQEPQNT